MEKIKLAQKRNYFKFVLMGMMTPIDKLVLSENELKCWGKMEDIRLELIKNFDSESLRKGLNVPIKCWCNKPAKYIPIGYPNNTKQNLVCKKHENYENLNSFEKWTLE